MLNIAITMELMSDDLAVSRVRAFIGEINKIPTVLEGTLDEVQDEIALFARRAFERAIA